MKRTILTIEVTYNEEITDPEAIATAADMLLGIALSTPELLSEYGNPEFGEFFVGVMDVEEEE